MESTPAADRFKREVGITPVKSSDPAPMELDVIVINMVMELLLRVEALESAVTRLARVSRGGSK